MDWPDNDRHTPYKSPFWAQRDFGSMRVFHRGVVTALSQFGSWGGCDEKDLLIQVTKWAQSQDSCFALVVESSNWIIGVVDRVRSIPLYYDNCLQSPRVSDSPYSLTLDEKNLSWRAESVREMLLSGYVHGVNTLVENISTVAAGTAVVLNKTSWEQSVIPYFDYFPEQDVPATDRELVSRWSTALDRVFSNLAEDLSAKEVLVPLSGGLDSRLVLAKLCEHGCKEILAFSYGVKDNDEIRTAKLVATKLGVEWVCLDSQPDRLRDLYSSEERKNYSRFSGALHITPSFLEYEAIQRLKALGRLSNNPVIVNGLSGDFLFGGHVPDEVVGMPTREVVIRKIIQKHVSQIKSEDLSEFTLSIETRLRNELDILDIQDGDTQRLCAFVENWDWKERQAKAVMVHQRAYEFFGVDWRLPLWDKRLLSVASQIPLNGRHRQRTHLQYLEQSNHRELFVVPRVETKLWQGRWRLTPIVVKSATFALGRGVRSWCYRKLFYFGYYRHQLGLFGIRKFWQLSKISRPPYVVPIATILNLKEIGVLIDAYLDKRT